MENESAPNTPGRREPAAGAGGPAFVALFFVAYLLGAELGHWLSAEPGHFATFWPNSGLYLAALLRTPHRRWWAVLAAAVTANLTSDVLLHGQRLPVAIGFVLANTVEGAVGAALARHLLGASARLDTLRSVLVLFVIATAVSTPLGGLVGAATASAAFAAPLPQAWQLWWVADALGVLLTAPLVFALLDVRRWPRPARLLEGAALLAGLVVAGVFVFTATPPVAPIVLLLFLLWAAVRLDIPGVAVAAFVLAVVAVRCTVLGYGIFTGTGDLAQRVVAVQLFIAVPALVFYSFAVVLAERRRVEAGLEDRVRERTAALDAQRELLSVTLASIGDAVITTDTAGRVTGLNPVAEGLTGWTAAEASGRPLEAVFNIVNEDTRLPVENPALKALKRGAVVGLANHTILIARDGTERHIDDSAAPIRGRDGTVVGSVLVFRDIGDRRQAERELRESELRYRLVGEAANDAIWDWDLVTDRVTWNDGVCRVFGYTPEQVGPLAAWWVEHIHPDDRDRVARGIHAAIDGGAGAWSGEYRFRRADGSYAAVFDRGRVVRTDGRPARMVGSMLDLTERRRQEEVLEAGRRTLKTVVERCPFGIYIVDADFRIATMNADSQERAFRNVRPAVGRPFDEAMRVLWPEPVAADIIRTFRHTLDTGEPYCSKDFVNPRADIGETEGYEWELHRITMPDGRPGVVCYYFDATKLRQVQQELKEADRKKDEFLAVLAHELRNPLAPVRNGLQVMKLAGGNAAAVEKVRSMMERQVGQMAHLIDDLMDLSRISRGKIVLQKTRLRLADALQDAVDIARPLVEERGHDLVLDGSPDPVFVDADRTRLAQVFSNLLNNAAKYTDKGGRIRLAVGRAGGDAVVTVEDDGVGIPAHMLTRVFEMFAQVDRSLEKAQGGLGIGLNIVKRLVEMHGGTIVAESGGHGMGSRFTVRLPVVPAVTADPPAAGGDAATAKPARRRLLVVDDNEDGAASLAEMLNLMGNDTRVAHDGLEAVAVAEAFRPDVILMDIGMPRLNGFDACRRIRERPWGKTPVMVAQTGWGQEGDKQKAKDAGFDLHMVKPVDPAELERLLAGLMATTG